MYRPDLLCPWYKSRFTITYFKIVQKLHKNANLIQLKNVIEFVTLSPKTFCEGFARYLKKEQPTNFSENDHAEIFSLSAKIQTYFLI